MAVNVITTKYIVDASQAYREADKVEARYKKVDTNTKQAASSPITRAGQLAPNTIASRAATQKVAASEATAATAAAEANAAKLAGVSAATAAIVTGTVLAVGAIFAAAAIGFQKSITAYEELEKRSRALKAAASDLGINYLTAAQAVKEFGDNSRYSAEEAQKLYIASASASKGTATSTKELTDAITEISAKRNLSVEQSVAALESLEKGEATAAISGRNASAVLEIYASSLGRVSSSLSDSEKKQALLNEAIRQGNLAAGSAADIYGSREVALKKLSDTVREFLGGIGEKLTPGVVNFLNYLNGTGTPTDSQIDTATLEANKKKFEEYKRLYAENQALFSKTRSDPNSSLTSFAITKFGNFRDIQNAGSPIEQTEKIKEAVVEANKFLQTYKKSIGYVVERGDIQELKETRQDFEKLKNLFSFDDYKQISKQLNDAIRVPIEQGLTKVKELQSGYKTLFEDLTKTANADNPYVSFFIESARAATQFEKSLAGLTDSTKKYFTDLQKKQEEFGLFKLRVDGRIQASDLRAQAQQIRDSGQTEEADKLLAAAISRYQKNEASGFFQNVRRLSAFYDKASPDSKVALFDFQRQNEEASGLFRNPAYQNIVRAGLAKQEFDQSAEGRFQKQVDELNKTKARTPEERAFLEEKLISLGKNFDPKELNQQQKNLLAEALENQATRVEKREQEAQTTRKEMLAVFKNLDKNGVRLRDIASTKGIKGVEAEITIKDETEAGVNYKIDTAGPDDVAQVYGGFLSGGSGGLSNR